MKKSILIVTQARVGSSRFPEKVLKKLGRSTLLGTHIYRLKRSKKATKILVATTNETKSNDIVKIARDHSVEFFNGSTENVLDRYYQATKKHKSDYVVRVTSDCPLIDGILIDSVVEMVIKNDLDYGSNTLIDSYPDGQDVEVFKFGALEKAWNEATLPSEKEHVTSYIKKNCDFNKGSLFKSMNLGAVKNYTNIRMTVDEPSDLDAIKILIKNLGIDKRWQEYAEYILGNAVKFNNQNITRNEGYLKSLKLDG